ncbi:pep-cterm sorting domain-containing protein [Anaeramoeba ignava]|uniref:Pep-cterm sorting domain-containing protein n=1 Tax=Anaeramoeba ignava TaxID=1746090 RepID=A0A9Q0LXF5_ANAIG|nr:pep-cterm sorting domain-containing protein [Anaeramoeba ignava]
MENYSNLEKLSNDLKNLFQNEKEEESHFDFEIICEQNQISFKTHKSILSSRSQYFKSLFKSKMKEYQENKMILKDVSSSILFPILNYFYSGKIEINLENAIQILIFSSKYLIDELIEISTNFIKNNLQFETIVDVLKLSESMNLNQLLDYSYQFIFENFEKFIKTSFFLELEENHLNSILLNNKISIDEFEIFQLIIKWGKHKSNINQEKELEKEEKEKVQNQISNVTDKIRFIDFSKQELEDSLKEELIPNQISQKLIQFQKLQNQENEKELTQFIENENQNSFIFQSRIRFKSEIIQDFKYIEKLKEWINDNEFFSKMKKGYSAKRDGFDCKNWHEKCDDKGKTLIVIKTKDNFIFGGFTQVGFLSGKTRYLSDPDAFIFSLRNPTNSPPHQFRVQKEKEQYAIFFHSGFGPRFGRYDDIWLDPILETGGTYFGNSYELPEGIEHGTDQANKYFANSYDEWKVEEVETFFLIKN